LGDDKTTLHNFGEETLTKRSQVVCKVRACLHKGWVELRYAKRTSLPAITKNKKNNMRPFSILISTSVLLMSHVAVCVAEEYSHGLRSNIAAATADESRAEINELLTIQAHERILAPIENGGWVKPPWWRQYKKTFSKLHLKKCVFPNGELPVEGSFCTSRGNHDSVTCMFGTQTCEPTSGPLPGLVEYTGQGLGSVHPTSRCTCQDQKWNCGYWNPCATALSGDFGAYPGYMGMLNPRGKVIVRFNAEGSFLLKLRVEGLEASCTNCGVHIHSGTTCTDALAVGPHFWNVNTFGSAPADDPWNKFGYYNSTGTGRSKAVLAGDSGLGYKDNLGRTVVLHSANGTRVACAVLKADDSALVNRVLKAVVGPYPGYTGTLAPRGNVFVRFFGDRSFQFALIANGLPVNCAKCGVHIHTGTTCTVADAVAGHYWNPSNYGTVDPWTVVNGSYYNSDAVGHADRYFHLDDGYGIDRNYGHAVVFHDGAGTRIACGVLSIMEH